MANYCIMTYMELDKEEKVWFQAIFENRYWQQTFFVLYFCHGA
jgi:hypothetical protein